MQRLWASLLACLMGAALAVPIPLPQLEPTTNDTSYAGDKYDCDMNGQVFNNGEKLVTPDDLCKVCFCRGGQVVCTPVTCYTRDDCEPQDVPGRCCPKYDQCPPLGVRNSSQAMAMSSPELTTTFRSAASPALRNEVDGVSENAIDSSSTAESDRYLLLGEVPSATSPAIPEDTESTILPKSSPDESDGTSPSAVPESDSATHLIPDVKDEVLPNEDFEGSGDTSFAETDATPTYSDMTETETDGEEITDTATETDSVAESSEDTVFHFVTHPGGPIQAGPNNDNSSDQTHYWVDYQRATLSPEDTSSSEDTVFNVVTHPGGTIQAGPNNDNSSDQTGYWVDYQRATLSLDNSSLETVATVTPSSIDGDNNTTGEDSTLGKATTSGTTVEATVQTTSGSINVSSSDIALNATSTSTSTSESWDQHRPTQMVTDDIQYVTTMSSVVSSTTVAQNITTVNSALSSSNVSQTNSPGSNATTVGNETSLVSADTSTTMQAISSGVGETTVSTVKNVSEVNEQFNNTVDMSTSRPTPYEETTRPPVDTSTVITDPTKAILNAVNSKLRFDGYVPVIKLGLIEEMAGHQMDFDIQHISLPTEADEYVESTFPSVEPRQQSASPKVETIQQTAGVSEGVTEVTMSDKPVSEEVPETTTIGQLDDARIATSLPPTFQESTTDIVMSETSTEQSTQRTAEITIDNHSQDSTTFAMIQEVSDDEINERVSTSESSQVTGRAKDELNDVTTDVTTAGHVNDGESTSVEGVGSTTTPDGVTISNPAEVDTLAPTNQSVNYRILGIMDTTTSNPESNTSTTDKLEIDTEYPTLSTILPEAHTTGDGKKDVTENSSATGNSDVTTKESGLKSFEMVASSTAVDGEYLPKSSELTTLKIQDSNTETSEKTGSVILPELKDMLEENNTSTTESSVTQETTPIETLATHGDNLSQGSTVSTNEPFSTVPSSAEPLEVNVTTTAPLDEVSENLNWVHLIGENQAVPRAKEGILEDVPENSTLFGVDAQNRDVATEALDSSTQNLPEAVYDPTISAQEQGAELGGGVEDVVVDSGVYQNRNDYPSDQVQVANPHTDDTQELTYEKLELLQLQHFFTNFYVHDDHSEGLVS